MHQVLLLLLLLTIVAVSHQQNETATQNKIRELFGSGPFTTTPTGPNDCVCVSYYLCTESNQVNTNGRGLIDIRADEDGPCGSYMDWCCSLANITDKKIEPVVNKKDGCGWRNADGVGFRTTGDFGNEAKFGEFPWMVAILFEETLDDSDEILASYQCGGSLIHPQVVLTAAHCVSNREKTYFVRAGEWDSQMTKELYPFEDSRVKSIAIHPDYYAGALFNDVAVIILESPFNLSYPNIDLACLAPQGAEIQADTRCFVTGWGKDSFGEKGTYQVILKKIDLPIVDSDTCQDNLRATRLGKYFQLNRSFICAGGEKGKDACKGDGGSPLVCPIPGQKDRYQQAGIVAWGVGCGEEKVPGVYTDVALFRDWINEQVVNNNLDVSTYTY